MLNYSISSNSVFELVEIEVEAIADYLDSGEQRLLTEALRKIGEADVVSQGHPLVQFYQASIYDLLGRLDEAEALFTGLDVPTAPEDQAIRDEVQCNIGVVNLHRLTRETTALPDRKLDLRPERAHTAFLNLTAAVGPAGTANTPVPPGMVDELEAMTKALRAVYPDDTDPVGVVQRQAQLARYLALQCIPETPSDAKRSVAERRRLAANHTAAIGEANKVLSACSPSQMTEEQDRRWQEATAIAHNAKGRAEMYYIDYVRHPEERLQRLEAALTELKVAREAYPNDWTYNRDIASCLMRLGHWRESKSDLAEAADQLERVLSRLPSESYYDGSVMFQLGRVYRLQKRGVEALAQFQKVSVLPPKQRSVGQGWIDYEITLAQEGKTTFP